MDLNQEAGQNHNLIIQQQMNSLDASIKGASMKNDLEGTVVQNLSQKSKSTMENSNQVSFDDRPI